MVVVPLCVCLLQFASDPVRSTETINRISDARERARARELDEIRSAERAQFEVKFNEFVTALEAFTSKYNKAGGNVWPKKEADALRRALDALQSTQSWRAASKDKR